MMSLHSCYLLFTCLNNPDTFWISMRIIARIELRYHIYISVQKNWSWKEGTSDVLQNTSLLLFWNIKLCVCSKKEISFSTNQGSNNHVAYQTWLFDDIMIHGAKSEWRLCFLLVFWIGAQILSRFASLPTNIPFWACPIRINTFSHFSLLSVLHLLLQIWKVCQYIHSTF